MTRFASKILYSRWFAIGAATLFVIALFGLRFLPAGQARFAVDEAHHAGWARLIANGDPFMRTTAADKPPQLYYLVAASFKLFGENEAAARLPNALLGALLVLPLWGLARPLYPTEPAVALLAVALLALSPLAQTYAPTVFTDPIMAFWVLVCAWLVSARRYTWAGVALGMAICGKQQALFFLPFPVFLALLIIAWDNSFGLKNILWGLLKASGRVLIGTVIPVLVVVGFDKFRGQTSSLTYGASINGDKLGLVSITSWPQRLGNWWDRVLQFFFIPDPLGLLLLALLLGYGAWVVWRLWQDSFYYPAEVRKSSPVEGFARLADLALILAVLVVMLWHTALTFPVWDRYLLPMVPFAALLVARAVVWWAGLLWRGNRWLNWRVAGLSLVVLLLMVGPVAQAAAYKLPIGGDYLAFSGRGPGAHHAFDGIELLAIFFKNNAPPGSTVFHEEMDWHFSYYLFGLPVQIPSNFSKPLDPATVAAAAARGPAYVVFADWQETSFFRLSQGLTPYGLMLEESYDIYPGNGERLSFAVYTVSKI